MLLPRVPVLAFARVLKPLLPPISSKIFFPSFHILLSSSVVSMSATHKPLEDAQAGSSATLTL